MAEKKHLLTRDVVRVLAADAVGRSFLTKDPRRLLGECLWGERRVAEAIDKHNNGSNDAQASEQAGRSGSFIVGSVEAVGSGKVLLARFSARPEWSAKELRQQLAARLGGAFENPESFCIFKGHGGSEILEYATTTTAATATATAATVPATAAATTTSAAAAAVIIESAVHDDAEQSATSSEPSSTAAGFTAASLSDEFVLAVSLRTLCLSREWEARLREGSADFSCDPDTVSSNIFGSNPFLLALSPDSRLLATVHKYDRHSVGVAFWDVETGQPTGFEPYVCGYYDYESSPPVLDMCFSRDGQFLAFGSRPMRNKVGFISPTPKNVSKSCEAVSLFGPHRISSITFAGEGIRARVVAAMSNSRVHVYSLSGTLINAISSAATRGVRAIAVSPDAALLVTGSKFHQAYVSVLDTGEVLLPHDLYDADGEAHKSSDGAATVNGDRYNRGKRVLRTRGPINKLAFSEDGSQVWCICKQGRLRCWDVKSGHEVHNVRTRRQNVSLALGGGRVAIGGVGNRIDMFDAATGTLAVSLKFVCPLSRAPRQGSATESALHNLAQSFIVTGIALTRSGGYVIVCRSNATAVGCMNRAWMHRISDIEREIVPGSFNPRK